MPEQVLSGGTFGASSAPRAPHALSDLVVHGGPFGGVPVGDSPRPSAGWPLDQDEVLDDALWAYSLPLEYQPAAGAPYLVRSGGIYSATHREIDPSSGAVVTSREPHVGVRASEVEETWTDEDLVVTGGRLFRVWDRRPDSGPGARLMLHEVEA